MKRTVSLLGMVILLAVSGGTSYAWHVSGTVNCTDNTPIGNVAIHVTGASCFGAFDQSTTTDSTGAYFMTLPDCAGTFTACLDTSTLPSGAALTSPACVPFDTMTQIFVVVGWTASCGSTPPPPCPPCVDPLLGLGAASATTVLELGAHQVSITGPAGGIIGNVYIASGGKANWSGGGEYLMGDVFLGPGAQYQNSGVPVAGSIFFNQDLSAQISAAYAAYNNYIALPATQTYTGGAVITGGAGQNVVDVPGDLHPNGKTVWINGPAGSLFIVRVHGLLKLDGGGQIRAVGGVQPSGIIYVVVGAGSDVGATGGGGGSSCCKAIYDGTILAPYRKIALSPGLVNGEIISGLDISIVSGSGVHCPVCP
jgi:hypothetical protein